MPQSTGPAVRGCPGRVRPRPADRTVVLLRFHFAMFVLKPSCVTAPDKTKVPC